MISVFELKRLYQSCSHCGGIEAPFRCILSNVKHNICVLVSISSILPMLEWRKVMQSHLVFMLKLFLTLHIYKDVILYIL